MPAGMRRRVRSIRVRRSVNRWWCTTARAWRSRRSLPGRRRLVRDRGRLRRPAEEVNNVVRAALRLAACVLHRPQPRPTRRARRASRGRAVVQVVSSAVTEKSGCGRRLCSASRASCESPGCTGCRVDRQAAVVGQRSCRPTPAACLEGQLFDDRHSPDRGRGAGHRIRISSCTRLMSGSAKARSRPSPSAHRLTSSTSPSRAMMLRSHPYSAALVIGRSSSRHGQELARRHRPPRVSGSAARGVSHGFAVTAMPEAASLPASARARQPRPTRPRGRR